MKADHRIPQKQHPTWLFTRESWRSQGYQFEMKQHVVYAARQWSQGYDKIVTNNLKKSNNQEVVQHFDLALCLTEAGTAA